MYARSAPARLLALLAVITVATSTAFAQQPAAKPPAIPDTIDFQKDVVYGKGGGKDLTLNLARPKVIPSAAPCIVIIHGGGWAAGKKEQHNDLAVTFASKGYVAVTVGYRLAPDAVFPAQIEDVKCAVRFLRANSEKYKLDPNRIGAVGFSAGAHLSMMLGVTERPDGLEGEGGHADQPSRVQAVVSFFGPTDLTAPEIFPEVSPILKKFLGGTLSEKPDLYKKASPVTYVNRDAAPMLLIQGTNDILVNWKQAIRMVEALIRNNIDGRLELLLGLGHGWGGKELIRTAEVTFSFFDEKLSKPKP